MHVAGLLPVYPPAARFGAPLATHHLLRHLTERGHTVSVARIIGHGPGYMIDGVEVVRARGLDGCRQLAAQADVIVSHGGSTLADQITQGRPHVRIAHGLDATDLDVDVVAVNSRALRDHLVSIGRIDHDRVIVTYPVVPRGDHLVERGDAVTIVNCSKDKGIKTAWRAAELLPDRPFLGVQGGYGYQLAPRAPNFTTIPTQCDMRSVWAQTRVLLMPSAFETWGMVGVEAMCSGIPVIAHPTPGLCESLGDAGIFVDRNDPDGWVKAILTLDDPVTYAAASGRARKRFGELEPEMQAGLDRFADAVEALCGL